METKNHNHPWLEQFRKKTASSESIQVGRGFTLN